MVETSPGKILVVDDDSGNLVTLNLILKSEGHHVRTVSNGFDALKMVIEDVPDLVLLDVMMPKMDGYEVCRRLKDEVLTREVPVVFLSGLTSPEEKVKAFKAGGVDYIVKPFDAIEVLARVKTHLALYRIQNRLSTEVQARTGELENKNLELYEVNITLRRLLQEIENEKQEIGRTMRMNIEKLVLPNLDKMVGGSIKEQSRLRDTITRNLRELAQPLVAGNVDIYLALSPAELRVLNLIKQGRRSKEIAADLKISVQTVATHRKNIRKKLNIAGKKVNLTSFANRHG